MSRSGVRAPAVFLGPSLPLGEARARLAARYLPPVRQGDVYRLARQDPPPAAIGIIDGYFHQVPAVWHKEILFALERGIPVLGAASMGALRAAELAAFGMIGIGTVYEAYAGGRFPGCDELFEDDDEVAVVHGPAELGYPALSVAMVDIRASLGAAAAAGVIDGAELQALAAGFKALAYRERSWEALPGLAARCGCGAVGERLQAWLPAGAVSVKRADALALLARLADPAALPAPVARAPFERTTLWAGFVESAEQAAPLELAPLEAAVLDELRLDPAAYLALRRDGAMRVLALDGLAPGAVPAAARRQALAAWRERHGLWSRAALDRWLAAAGLEPAAIERLMADEAALDAAVADDSPALAAAILDLLRLDGRFAALAARARDKAGQAALDQPRPPAALLLAWYFEQRLGQIAPPAPEAFASRLGFASMAAFIEAIRREYVHARTRGELPAP